jgi:hypothetical protein
LLDIEIHVVPLSTSQDFSLHREIRLANLQLHQNQYPNFPCQATI